MPAGLRVRTLFLAEIGEGLISLASRHAIFGDTRHEIDDLRRDRWIRSTRQQQTNRIRAALRRGEHERRLSPFGLFGVCVGAAVEQRRDRRYTSRQRSEMERS